MDFDLTLVSKVSNPVALQRALFWKAPTFRLNIILWTDVEELTLSDERLRQLHRKMKLGLTSEEDLAELRHYVEGISAILSQSQVAGRPYPADERIAAVLRERFSLFELMERSSSQLSALVDEHFTLLLKGTIDDVSSTETTRYHLGPLKTARDQSYLEPVTGARTYLSEYLKFRSGESPAYLSREFPGHRHSSFELLELRELENRLEAQLILEELHD